MPSAYPVHLGVRVTWDKIQHLKASQCIVDVVPCFGLVTVLPLV